MIKVEKVNSGKDGFQQLTGISFLQINSMLPPNFKENMPNFQEQYFQAFSACLTLFLEVEKSIYHLIFSATYLIFFYLICCCPKLFFQSSMNY